MSTSLWSDTDLLAAVDDPHDRALAALEERPFDAVAWCSAHLAATDSVLYRAARRRLPGSSALRAARHADRVLQHALCRLDRRLTGDVHLATVPVATVTEQVRSALAAHTAAEHAVVQALVEVLDAAERRALAERLAHATALGPTRPHPHTRPNRLVAVVDALADRVRDVMDNRLSPTGRPARAARAPGRWGAYLMGLPWPDRAPGSTRDGAAPPADR